MNKNKKMSISPNSTKQFFALLKFELSTLMFNIQVICYLVRLINIKFHRNS